MGTIPVNPERPEPAPHTRAPEGTEPIAQIEGEIPRRGTRHLSEGVRVTLGGRTYRLRGLRRPPAGLLALLAVLGPGLIAGIAGDDAGAIATLAQAGAQFGYMLLWVMLILTVSLGVVQETSARLGAATGRGLLDLVRERFGVRWGLVAVGVVLVANGGLVISEFVAAGAAFELFGVGKYIAVPLAAALLAYLVISASYNRVERVFLLMALIFIAYPIASVLAHPDWQGVARGLAVPSLSRNPAYIQMVVALLGATLTPYQQIFQQSAAVESGSSRHHYGPERADAYVGAVASNAIAAFVIIATAATLHAAGQTNIDTAAQAAQALKPIAGPAATIVFAIGLLGAALLAAAVLPIATAYSVAETFGFRKGVNLDFRRGRLFFGLFIALLAVGAAVALIPGVPVIALLVGVQTLNGVLVPVMLLFMLLLANDAQLTGHLKNGRWDNILGWGTLVVVTLAVLVLLGSQILGLAGVHVIGG